jgi:hypothetical protein
MFNYIRNNTAQDDNGREEKRLKSEWRLLREVSTNAA